MSAHPPPGGTGRSAASSQGQLQEVHPTSGPSFSYRVETVAGRVLVELDGQHVRLGSIHAEGGEGWCQTEDGRVHRFAAAWVGEELHLWLDGGVFVFTRPASSRRRGREARSDGSDILAPMPGTVLEVLVQPGDRVERGQRVVLMESMKMELSVNAQSSGVVKRVAAEPGSRVDRGMRLVEME